MKCLVAQLDNGSISELEFDREVNAQAESDSPEEVTASTRFADDVRALTSIFSASTTPEVSLRSKEIVTVIYGFGDASGTRLGATFSCGSGFTFGIGVWSGDGKASPQTGENSRTLSTLWKMKRDPAIWKF